MLSRGCLFALLITLFFAGTGRAASMVLVDRGASKATILLPADPAAEETKAAAILQKNIRRMTGVTVPIRQEPDKPSGYLLSVGKTKMVPPALYTRLKIGEPLIIANPIRDAFILSSSDTADGEAGKIFFLGHRGKGTIFAVYTFLEDLGCRWFFAYEAGVCIPHLDRIAVTAYDRFEVPDFAFRRHYTWDGPRTRKTWQKERAWFEANKMDDKGPKEGSSGHNFTAIWPAKLFEEHPEFFPLNKVKIKIAAPEIKGGKAVLAEDGKDDIGLDEKKPEPTEKWARVCAKQRCLSNPGLIKYGIAWAFKTMKEHPDYDMVPFIQSDGSSHCQCENCRKLGNFADQNIYLANQVGKGFFKKYPHKMLHIISYFESARVPHRKIDGYDTGTDRVWVTIFSNFAKAPFDDLIEGWGKVCHHLEITDAWNFFSGEKTRRPGWPRAFSRWLVRYPFYKRNNIIAVSAVNKSEWAQQGLARYLSAKLMWNAGADVEALKQDFYRRMFPNASKLFEQFNLLYGDVQYGKINMLTFLRKGFTLLEKIRKSIKTDEEQRRWEFYALYLHDLVLEEKLTHAKTAYEKLMGNRAIVQFLRAIEDRGVLESSMRIGCIYLPRLEKLRWAKFTGPNAPKLKQANAGLAENAGDGDDELGLDEAAPAVDNEQYKRHLTWWGRRQAILKSIPVLELDRHVIETIFQRDRAVYAPVGR